MDFESVEDVIDREERLLDSCIESKRDVRELQYLYEKCRLELSRSLTAAASTVSMTLIRNNVTATTHREPYKEYAELHQKALNYLVDRTNRLLGRYRREFPDLGPANTGPASIWPTEQMSILNEFVDMTRDLSWVHQRHLTSQRDLIFIDYDQVEQIAIQGVMAITYIILVFSVPTAVRFTITSIGVNQASLTAFLLTTSWPLYLVRSLYIQRRDLHLSHFISLSALGRGLVLGGLSTSCILLQSLAIHGMPLYSYLVIISMCHLILHIVLYAEYRYPITIISIVIALASMGLIMGSASDILLTGVAVITAVLPECHNQAKRRLFKSDRLQPEHQVAESEAISSLGSFLAMIVILSVVGEWHSMAVATASLQPTSWPAFLAICLLIAVAAFLTDYVGLQLESDGHVNLNLLRTISYVISISFGLGWFQEPYTALSISAVAISLLALLINIRIPARNRPTDAQLDTKPASNNV